MKTQHKSVIVHVPEAAEFDILNKLEDFRTMSLVDFKINRRGPQHDIIVLELGFENPVERRTMVLFLEPNITLGKIPEQAQKLLDSLENV